jgi:hypothetical protein
LIVRRSAANIIGAIRKRDHGFARLMLQADRDQQIAAVATWVTGGDDTLH